jgi:hypothetical protein
MRYRKPLRALCGIVLVLVGTSSCHAAPERSTPRVQAGDPARTDTNLSPSVRARPAAAQATVSVDLVPGVRVTPFVWVDSVGPMLRATVTLRNSRRDTVRLTFGGCPIEVRAYSTPVAREPARWKLSDSRPLCPAFERVVTLAPRNTTVLRTTAPVASMKDVSAIERGRYTFTITVRAERPAVTTPEQSAGEVRIP